jgi:hypothetical protein
MFVLMTKMRAMSMAGEAGHSWRNLRESGSIEQAAATVMLVCRVEIAFEGRRDKFKRPTEGVAAVDGESLQPGPT